MWHRRRRHRLGVTTPHRKSILKNLVKGLALERQIVTTLARAKETSRLADQMVTLAKSGTLVARRRLMSSLGSEEAARVFVNEIAPRLKDRFGGYTRVLKLGRRPGDGAEKALVEFSVPIEKVEKKKSRKEKKTKPAPPEKVSSKEEKKEAAPEKTKSEKKLEKEVDKEEREKRGGFLSKLRKFLRGDE